MKKNEKLTAKQLETIENFESTVFNTVFGRLSVSQIHKRLGDPTKIMKYAKIEVSAKGLSVPTIEVKRLVGIDLQYSRDLVLRNVPKGVANLMNTCIETEVYIRKSEYNPEKIPSATALEIKQHTKQQSND